MAEPQMPAQLRSFVLPSDSVLSSVPDRYATRCPLEAHREGAPGLAVSTFFATLLFLPVERWVRWARRPIAKSRPARLGCPRAGRLEWHRIAPAAVSRTRCDPRRNLSGDPQHVGRRTSGERRLEPRALPECCEQHCSVLTNDNPANINDSGPDAIWRGTGGRARRYRLLQRDLRPEVDCRGSSQPWISF
jgi:hypothetical protein